VAQSQKNIAKGIIFTFATIVVGSGAGAASKWISNDVPVPVIVLIQFSVCLLILLPKLMRQPLYHLKSKHWQTHLIRGFAGWLSFFCFYAGLKQIPLVDASLLRNAAPLFVPLIAWLWVRAKIPKRRWLPLVIGFIGIILILRPGSAGTNQGHLIGLLSGIGLTVSMVGTSILSRTETRHTIIGYYFILSLLCSLPFGIYYRQEIPLWTWPYLLFIGVSIFVTMQLYTLAYSYAKPSVISPISYFSVIVSGILGWLIWQHIPSNTALIGALFVILAGSLTLYLNNDK